MKLSEIANIVLLRSGQYIVSPDYTSLSNIQLNMQAFFRMIDTELKDYEKFIPVTKHFTYPSMGGGTTSQLSNDLTNDPTNGENGPPVFITDVLPVGIVNFISVQATWIGASSMNRYDLWSPNRLVIPRTFLWNYYPNYPSTNPGNWLCCSELGTFDVNAAYKYVRRTTKDGSGNLVDVDFPELDELSTPIFFDIITARFKQSVGLSRRAFTYQDLPVLTDSQALVEEAKTEYQAAREQLYARHKWHRSIRV